jgi:hypothetical protein
VGMARQNARAKGRRSGISRRKMATIVRTRTCSWKIISRCHIQAEQIAYEVFSDWNFKRLSAHIPFSLVN